MKTYTLYNLVLYYGELQFRHALNLCGANQHKKYMVRIANIQNLIIEGFLFEVK
jgi:hypothetical protein